MNVRKYGFDPVFNRESQVLILGSFPSVKSQENKFFYGHPQNRFWKVLAAVFREQVPVTVAEKTVFLHDHHIALWDVIGSCEIAGSADSTIRQVEPNDLSPILSGAQIRAVFCNGSTSWQYYKKYTQAKTGMEATPLPSTSPAKAAWTLEKLTDAWSVLRNYLPELL